MPDPVVLEKLINKTWSKEDLEDPQFLQNIRDLIDPMYPGFDWLGDIEEWLSSTEIQNLLSWLAKKSE